MFATPVAAVKNVSLKVGFKETFPCWELMERSSFPLTSIQ